MAAIQPDAPFCCYQACYASLTDKERIITRSHKATTFDCKQHTSWSWSAQEKRVDPVFWSWGSCMAQQAMISKYTARKTTCDASRRQALGGCSWHIQYTDRMRILHRRECIYMNTLGAASKIRNPNVLAREVACPPTRSTPARQRGRSRYGSKSAPEKERMRDGDTPGSVALDERGNDDWFQWEAVMGCTVPATHHEIRPVSTANTTKAIFPPLHLGLGQSAS